MQRLRAPVLVTSGTIFATESARSARLSLGIAIFANGAKGHSALQLSRDLCCQYKTAFVLAHKLREAMEAEHASRDFAARPKKRSTAHISAGQRNRQNLVAERVDRRAAEEQTGKRQVVVVMRERHGRTLAFRVRQGKRSHPDHPGACPSGSIVHADEARGWDALHAHYDMRRINHSVAFSKDGACTNQAESFFSRLRRAEIGTHHRFPVDTSVLCVRDGVARGSSPRIEWRAFRADRGARHHRAYEPRMVAVLATERGMKNEHVLSGLIAKRGNSPERSRRFNANCANCAGDRSRRCGYPHVRSDVDLDDIRPRLPPRHQAFRGEVSRIVLNTLRKSGKPMPVAEITFARSRRARPHKQ